CVELVGLFVEDAANACVHDGLEAVDARSVRDVDVGFADRGALARRLRDRIDLRVDRAETVLNDLTAGIARLVDLATDVETVRHARRRAVVAGRENVALADDDGADLGPQACRAFGHLARDRHEIFVPSRPPVHGAHVPEQPAGWNIAWRASRGGTSRTR